MKTRTANPNATQYRWYGGKGVKVCDEWQEFVPFRDWALSHGYAEDLTIERRNSSGDYEPSNCEWITGAENRRRATQRLARDAVLDIRRRRALRKTPLKVLAADHGVTQSAISLIIHRKTYAVVPMPAVMVRRA